VAAGVCADRVRRREAKPNAHTLLFILSVIAIVPLATLLSHATESVAAKTGDGQPIHFRTDDQLQFR
jgi:Ca2+/H+ antiporter